LLFAVLALPVAAVAIALVLTAALLAFLLFLIATRELLPLSGLLLAALSLPLTLLLTLSSFFVRHRVDSFVFSPAQLGWLHKASQANEILRQGVAAVIKAVLVDQVVQIIQGCNRGAFKLDGGGPICPRCPVIVTFAAGNLPL
jgi:hypothetical protein